MKKIFAFVCAASLLLLTSCGSVPVEEPFSADFEITKSNEVLTSKVFIDNYQGETRIYDSDSLSFSDIEQFFKSTVFFKEHDFINLPNGEVKIAMMGNYTEDDIASLSEIIDKLNSVPSFCGIREVSSNEANFIINFTSDEEQKLNIICSEFGYVTDAVIGICCNNAPEERHARICQTLLMSLGFRDECDSELDSCLSGADTITSTDLLLLDLLYTCSESGMSEQDFFSTLKNHFYYTEDLS